MKIIKINQVAGSGKTTSLINIINENKDKKVLFLSFSRMIIEDITSRLKKDVLDNVSIFTLHALAHSLLRTDNTYEIMSGYDQVVAMISRKRDMKKGVLSEFISLYINGLFDEIEKSIGLKKEAADFLWSEIEEDYNKVEKFSFDYLLYLFDKSIYVYAENLKYDILMVDEAQDLSPVQVSIIKAIIDINKDSELFTAYIVGDILQNIYKFRYSGASLLTEPITDNDEIKTKSLTYRCPRSIVDISNKIVDSYFENTPNKNELLLKANLISNSDKIGSYNYFQNKDDFISKMPEMINKTINANRKLGILVRNNYSILDLLAAIPEKHKDKVFVKEKDIFNSYAISVFEGLEQLYSCCINKNITEKDITKFLLLYGNFYFNSHKEMFNHIKKNPFGTPNFNQSYPYSLPNMITKFSDYKNQKILFSTYVDFFGDFISKSSFYSENKKETESFLNLLKRINTMEDYYKRKKMVTTVQTKLKDVNVIIMTIHSSKGFEMDDVVLYAMNYPVKTEMLEEIKLFYVAVTRTKDTLEQYGSNDITSIPFRETKLILQNEKNL